MGERYEAELKCGMYDDEPFYNDDPPECDHEEFEVDILTGRKTCDRCMAFCGYATDADIDAQIRWQQEFYDAMDREERHENRWYRRLWRWLNAPKANQEVADDEIPF